MKTKYTFTAILAAVLLSSCSKFDSMNENPYAVYEAPAESFVQQILYKTEYALVNSSREVFSQLVQQTVKVGVENASQMIYNYAIPESYNSNVWIELYKQLGNAEYMLATAKKADQPQMEGVALVLKTMLLSNLSDTYGNVPAAEAGQIALQDTLCYTTKYDTQKDIYRLMFASLERANEAFAEAQARKDADATYQLNFSATCDYTYGGEITKWRRFGNSLYLRLLMRCAMKVEEEDGGLLHINDDFGDLDVVSKISELYDGFVSGSGNYPIMRNRADGCIVPFSSTDAALYTPFFSTTSGNWKVIVSCETLFREMVPSDKKIDDLGYTYYERNLTLWPEDPRYLYYFAKDWRSVPTQMPYEDMEAYRVLHSSSWYMTNGNTYDAAGNPKNFKLADHYSIMNFSENLFIFAEAGQRGYISASTPEVKRMLMQGIQESVLEWADCLDENSESVTDFVEYIGSKADPDNLLELILTQKWISLFMVGGENWYDYRRTGFPKLKINTAVAENSNILPTRLRYPADEKYRNVQYYQEAIDGWLGGTNNMTVDTWWASTKESRTRRGLK